MPVAPQPDIQLTLSPVLLRDLMDAVSIALPRGIKDKAKVELAQWHLYAAGRKPKPEISFTFTVKLLRSISECITIANTFDGAKDKIGLTNAAKARLGEWQVTMIALLPEEPVFRQVKMKL